MSGKLDIEPFRIDVADAALEDLNERLARTRFPEQIPGADWDYGTELGYLRELVGYWRDGYDWRKTEARLNELDHQVTEIDGARVHFVHARSPEPNAFPIVMTHGWPGSFVEFEAILPLLTDPGAHGGDPADALHVVCPSIPGYAFSGPTPRPGLGHPTRGARVGRVDARAGLPALRRAGRRLGRHDLDEPRARRPRELRRAASQHAGRRASARGRPVEPFAARRPTRSRR